MSETVGQRRPVFHRDRMEYAAFVAQVVSAVAVVVSLVFVGIQLRESNRVATRDEANSTQIQWSAFRSSIYGQRDTAEMFSAGLAESRKLDAADQMRFLYVMREYGWATYQLWDRVQHGLRPKAHFETGTGPEFLQVICTPGGMKAWARIQGEFPPDYVADIDRLARPFSHARKVRCAS